MTIRAGSRETWSKGGLLVAAAGALALSALLPLVAFAAPDCPLLIRGEAAAAHAAPETALRVTDLRRSTPISGRVPVGTRSVRVDLEFSPLRVPVTTVELSGGGDWSREITADTYDRGVGLYHVVATTDAGCVSDVWLVAEGSVLDTVAGRAAAASAAIGLLLQLFGLLRGSVWSFVGGIPTGLGIAVLLQQAGLVPLSAASVLASTGSSMGAGAVLRLVGSRLAGTASGPLPSARVTVSPRDMSSPQVGAEAPASAGAPSTPPGRVARNGGPRAAPSTARARPPTSAPPGTSRAAPPATTRAAPATTAATGRATANGGNGETPRHSYALLKSDDTVFSERPFELLAGLSPTPTPGVAIGDVVRPARITGAYAMTITLVADGFRLARGEKWRNDVPVTPDAPYPTFTVHLTADPQQDDVLDRTVQAYFSIGGEPVGFAMRAVRVARSAEVAGAAPRDAGAAVLALMSPPSGGDVADLTVQISRGKSEIPGRYRLTLLNPHGVPVPDEPLQIDLGDDAKSFATAIAEQGAAKDGDRTLYSHMRGLGRLVSRQIPPEFWPVLRAVHEAIGRRTPTILISTEEPYVPWELALLEQPLDPNAPPFLGAQARVGRWIPGVATAEVPARPPLVPPRELRVKSIAVITGTFANVPLVEAMLEEEGLRSLYQAVRVNAATVDVVECIAQGVPEAELLHFALHGKYAPYERGEGLILVDGVLGPLDVLGANLKWAPFVFLNACQVGSGELMLGDYAGMASSFLQAGASGVVAPLWSVRDDIARELALRFYDHIFKGDSPAEALRLERASFIDSPDTITATFLAYQYFGHPSLKLSRSNA